MKLKMRDMATNNILTFEGFKLRRTEFRFKNNKEMNNFFNEALIESPVKFLNLNDARTKEKMHVLFSWMMVHKMAAYAWFVPAAFAIVNHASRWMVLSMVAMAIFSFIRSKMLSRKLDDVAFGRSFFVSMSETDNFESLEEIRKELIEERNK